jgi:hypothetical protein
LYFGLALGSDCFLMRATAGVGNPSNVVDLYDSGTGRWSTAQLSQGRSNLAATSVGTVAMFAGGDDGKLLRIVFVLLCEGVLIAVARCVIIWEHGFWSLWLPCGSDCFLMRATSGGQPLSVDSNVVDLYDSGTGRWSTARLSQARAFLSATSVGTVAMFAGGELLRIVFVLLCEGVLIAVARCVMGTWVFVFRVAVRERLLSYARHWQVVVFPMLWTCTTAEQDDGRRLSSVRGAINFQRHLLERWPCLQEDTKVSC